MSAGCGSEDKLLSELREESAAAEDAAAGECGSAEGFGTGQSVGVEVGPAPGQSGSAEGSYDERGRNSVGGSSDERGQTETAEIYVHVCGAVRSPGVYELPAGSRFYEAVDAAGGFAEDACEDYLNMAATLADGSRLEIPTMKEISEREAPPSESAQGGKTEKSADHGYYTLEKDQGADPGGATGGGNGENGADGLVNLNTADIEELCRLPGIGEGRAKAILEYRQKQGGFQKKEDIMQVSGIGEKMYARMEAYLTVE